MTGVDIFGYYPDKTEKKWKNTNQNKEDQVIDENKEKIHIMMWLG